MATLLELPSRDQIAALDATDRMRLVQQLHQAECELAAATADLLDVMERQGDHAADGHSRITNLIVALTNTSGSDAAAKVKTMKTLRLLPAVHEQLRSGGFGVAQVQSVAGAYGNPRVRDFLPALEDQLLDWVDVDHHEFDIRVREFARLADADGAEQRDRARHERRSLHLSQSGDGFHGTFGCGKRAGCGDRQGSRSLRPQRVRRRLGRRQSPRR